MKPDEIAYKRQGEKLNQALDAIAHEFDAVIIIATVRTENGHTATMHRHAGNWHAQNGMMRYLLKRRMHEARLEAEESWDPDGKERE